MQEDNVSLSLTIRGDPVKSENHFSKTVQEFRQFFLTASTEELYVSEYLRFIDFLGKTTVCILSIIGGDNCVFSDLKKICVIATERTH
jgi:hypothetical protein